jgi:hypothetical protein
MIRPHPIHALSLLLAACAQTPPDEAGLPAKETLHAVTADHRLVTINAGQPQKLLAERTLTGLQPGETVLGIDYRVAKGELFALGSTGRLYRIDPESGRMTPVAQPFAVKLSGSQPGFDFNPTVDRIRVVTDTGQNLRLHPETGAVVDADAKADGLQLDGTLAYDTADANAGQSPVLMAAAYTYNQDDEKITTNYAIDGRLGTLVTQGTREGAKAAVSPNTGRLFTVGKLGVEGIGQAAFDISDIDNAAYAALGPANGAAVLYRVDLASGKAARIGTVLGGQALRGIAIVP